MYLKYGCWLVQVESEESRVDAELEKDAGLRLDKILALSSLFLQVGFHLISILELRADVTFCWNSNSSQDSLDFAKSIYVSCDKMLQCMRLLSVECWRKCVLLVKQGKDTNKTEE